MVSDVQSAPDGDAGLTFPFARLNASHRPDHAAGSSADDQPAVGEPQGCDAGLRAPDSGPKGRIDGWNKYPPNQGIPDLNLAIVEWLGRRYRLPKGLLDPAQHVDPDRGQQGRRLHHRHRGDASAEGGRQSRSWRCPNPFYQAYLGGAVLSGARAIAGQCQCRDGLLARLPEHRRCDVGPDGGGLSLLARQSARREIASLDYLQKLIAKCRQHDTVAGRSTSAMPKSTRRRRRSAASRPRWRWMRPGPRIRSATLPVFHSLSKRSNAAGLRSGFMAGDPRLVAMLLRWRTYGGPQIPFAIQKASAALWREETHPLETREWYRKNFRVAEQILHNRFGYFTPGGGFFLWLDVGDGEEATRRCGARRTSRCCPAARSAARPMASTRPTDISAVALVHDEKTTREAMTRLATVL